MRESLGPSESYRTMDEDAETSRGLKIVGHDQDEFGIKQPVYENPDHRQQVDAYYEAKGITPPSGNGLVTPNTESSEAPGERRFIDPYGIPQEEDIDPKALKEFKAYQARHQQAEIPKSRPGPIFFYH